MRYVVVVATLFLCSGCAANRSVTFQFYPHVGDIEAFPRVAQAECEKYGMNAVFAANGSGDYGSSTKTYRCQPKG